jgi:hypothetical protein
MGILLEEIGKEHGITAQGAFQSFGQRSAAVDLAVNLPFVIVYILAANFLTRRLLKRYPPQEGWVTAVMMIILAALLFATGGLLLGREWSELVEGLRIGTHHLSNRAFRLPIREHASGAFFFGMTLFISIAIARFCAERNTPAAR